MGIRHLGDRTVAGCQGDCETREGGRADGPSTIGPKVRELDTEATEMNVEFREIAEGRELVFGAGGGLGFWAVGVGRGGVEVVGEGPAREVEGRRRAGVVEGGRRAWPGREVEGVGGRGEEREVDCGRGRIGGAGGRLPVHARLARASLSSASWLKRRGLLVIGEGGGTKVGAGVCKSEMEGKPPALILGAVVCSSTACPLSPSFSSSSSDEESSLDSSLESSSESSKTSSEEDPSSFSCFLSLFTDSSSLPDIRFSEERVA